MFLLKKKIKNKWYWYIKIRKKGQKDKQIYLGSVETIARKMEELDEFRRKLGSLPYNPL